MKAFLQRIVGVDALKAQIGLLKQELEHMRDENERIQLKVSGLGKYPKLDLSHSQASKLQALVQDFRAKICFEKGGFVTEERSENVV